MTCGRFCAVCTRPLIYDDGEKCCDDCIDFFINYFDSDADEDYACKNNNQCLKEPNLEGISCKICRAAKCMKAGVKLPEEMLSGFPAANCQIDPNFVANLLESLKNINKPPQQQQQQ